MFLMFIDLFTNKLTAFLVFKKVNNSKLYYFNFQFKLLSLQTNHHANKKILIMIK